MLYKVKGPALLSLSAQYRNAQYIIQMPFTSFCVAVFRSALFGRFRSWLGEVLGVELEPTVDISCARYEYTGKLSIKILQDLFIYFRRF